MSVETTRKELADFQAQRQARMSTPAGRIIADARSQAYKLLCEAQDEVNRVREDLANAKQAAKADIKKLRQQAGAQKATIVRVENLFKAKRAALEKDIREKEIELAELEQKINEAREELAEPARAEGRRRLQIVTDEATAYFKGQRLAS